MIALSGAPAEAQLVGDQEFDFELGGDPFQFIGSAGVADINVIEGNFSAFIAAGGGAVGNMCSFLLSPFIFPETNRATLRVEFETRYKTNEATGSFAEFEDPFHTQLVTERGAVDVLTIKTDGIFYSSSRPRTVVFEEAQEGGADVRLPRPPLIPTFEEGDLFFAETNELSVISTLSLSGSGCDPVQLKFSICNWIDVGGDSAAFIDEVQFDFTNSGRQCPPPPNGNPVGVERSPGPRQ